MIPVGPHGGDGLALARALGMAPDEVLDLSMNMNPFAPDIEVIAESRLWALRHYPDPARAHQVLAEAMDVDPTRLLLTNGGSEAIALVAAELGGRVRSEPEFALHPRGTTGPVWRSDPHSPSGHLAGPDETADVWDEAYYPMVTGRWTAGRPGIVVGSLTKLYACPGLRLGYVLADDVARFARHQPGWPVNNLALTVLEPLLGQTTLDVWAEHIREHRARLVAILAQVGLTALPSDAPWVIVPAPGLRERLAPSGILVRDCTSFGLPGHVRIGLANLNGLARLESALNRLPDPDPDLTDLTDQVI